MINATTSLGQNSTPHVHNGNMSSKVPESLRNVFDVLTVVGNAGPAGITTAAIAHETGHNIRTVFRHVAALRELGMVEQLTHNSARYRVGSGLTALAMRVDDQREFLRLSRETSDAVAELLHESVHVTVFDGGAAVTVAATNRPATMMTELDDSMLPQPGTRRAAHASASGKIFLAHRPRDLETYLLRPLHGFTPYTIVEPARLIEELARVRRNDWSVDEQEAIEGISCLAVPVWGVGGRVAGTLVVSTKNTSMNADLRERLLEKMLPAAHRFSKAIGGSRD